MVAQARFAVFGVFFLVYVICAFYINTTLTQRVPNCPVEQGLEECGLEECEMGLGAMAAQSSHQLSGAAGSLAQSEMSQTGWCPQDNPLCSSSASSSGSYIGPTCTNKIWGKSLWVKIFSKILG